MNPDGTKLDKRRAELFHIYVAKLFFMSKCGQPDLQTMIIFLTTLGQSPDKDYWKNLIRLMKFLMGVMTDALTLGGNGTIYVVKWWVDASYVMQTDFKSQTVGTMPPGQGYIMSASKKQKINTTSSCEAELVGVYDMMPQ